MADTDMMSEDASQQGKDGEISLSISETNKLRISLGLKPLNVDESTGTTTAGSTATVDVLVAPVIPFADRKLQELLEQDEIREQRSEYDAKLASIKTLGEDDGADAASWVAKIREAAEKKKQAQQMSQNYDDMDASNERATRKPKAKKPAYTSAHLKGLAVAHELGDDMVLTLKDQSVLDDDEDVLQNIDLMESNKVKENIDKLRKKNPYYDEDDPLGLEKKSLLSKYDDIDIITGDVKKENKPLFRLGKAVEVKPTEQELREKMKQSLVTLGDDSNKIASDYYTSEEMAQFKKKKHRKVRGKALKVDDLMDIAENSADHGSRMNRNVKAENDANSATKPGAKKVSLLDAMDVTEDNEDEDLEHEPAIVDEAEAEAEKQLQLALERARRAKIKTEKPIGLDHVVEQVSKNISEEKAANAGTGLVFSPMNEFVRSVGRDRDEKQQQPKPETVVKADVMDTTADDANEEQNDEPKEESDSDSDEYVDGILDDEIHASGGVAAFLQLARNKGMLETQKDDYYTDASKDKDRRGASSSSRDRDPFELKGYQPDVKIEHRDKSGKLLDIREAWKHHSHIFHGKGPGKKKTATRIQRAAEEQALKKMASSDTPLGTMALVQNKMAESASAHIVLSGQKTAPTMSKRRANDGRGSSKKAKSSNDE